jgi:membrane-bound lytic murein transglycosylase B
MAARPAATVATLALLVGTLPGCDSSTQSTPPAAATSPPSSAPPRPSEPPTPAEATTRQRSAVGSLPAAPSLRRADALATQIARAEAVLADTDARPGDLRRAGQFEQLVARLLATASAQRQQSVLARLGPAVRTNVRAEVEAAALLGAMTSPQERLPDWRIVEPPSPQVLLGHYRFAARRIGVPWSYLAAIHLVETRMGRIRGVSSAGALGPMQFLPTTWELYGEGGDINDVRDAILAAARLLRANGAPGEMAEAVWHYNPSDSYVGAVTRYAGQLQRDPLAYRGYWHWRVLYQHVRGTYVLDPGYPEEPARLLG